MGYLFLYSWQGLSLTGSLAPPWRVGAKMTPLPRDPVADMRSSQTLLFCVRVTQTLV